jgi:YVTN family beta-propeller protein
MKIKILLALTLLVCAGPAQWLETTIKLDSLEPSCVVYDSVNNTLYTAGDGPHGNGHNLVYAIDGTTNQIVAQIPAGLDGMALCCNPKNDKVYCANYSSASVTVINGASNQVVTTVAVDSAPLSLCYNPKNNKVYVANSGSNSVTIIDGVTDSVTIVVPVGACPSVVCCNPQDNKVYCANSQESTVTVIDGATGLVIATVVSDSYPFALCYNPRNDRVYCANYYSDSLSVIDGATDSVVANVAVGRTQDALCYNSVNDRVYCAGDLTSNVTVVDGATDSVIAEADGRGNSICALGYDSLNNRIYCAVGSQSYVSVIDGWSDTFDTVITQVPYGIDAVSFAYNPGANRVYVADNLGSIDIIGDSGSTGVRENRGVSKVEPGATIVRGVLKMPLTANRLPHTAGLLNIDGRKVLDLKPGANDVSRLAPGVYFVSEHTAVSSEPRRTYRVRKVVLTR